MKKIFKWIGTDGLLHILVCATIALALGYFVNLGLATFAAIFIGFGKEIIWDAWMNKGTFELKDLACDIMGAMSAFIIMLIASVL